MESIRIPNSGIESFRKPPNCPFLLHFPDRAKETLNTALIFCLRDCPIVSIPSRFSPKMAAEREETHSSSPEVIAEEEDRPALSDHALQALKEFLSEQSSAAGGSSEEVRLVAEDWRLSQFWYDRETAVIVANEIRSLWDSASSPVACVACPTIYAYLKDVLEVVMLWKRHPNVIDVQSGEAEGQLQQKISKSEHWRDRDAVWGSSSSSRSSRQSSACLTVNRNYCGLATDVCNFKMQKLSPDIPVQLLERGAEGECGQPAEGIPLWFQAASIPISWEMSSDSSQIMIQQLQFCRM
ncbi:hypothetical protein KSP40_PGU003297 [Platanthera guangdongensis]|uniref:Uncharacterized protein n=1 Tax=Platanthera guangdongensis TaxID=2320717 RepID=A0ABR2MXH0_9ASPA